MSSSWKSIQMGTMVPTQPAWSSRSAERIRASPQRGASPIFWIPCQGMLRGMARGCFWTSHLVFVHSASASLTSMVSQLCVAGGAARRQACLATHLRPLWMSGHRCPVETFLSTRDQQGLSGSLGQRQRMEVLRFPGWLRMRTPAGMALPGQFTKSLLG